VEILVSDLAKSTCTVSGLRTSGFSIIKEMPLH